MFNQFLVGFAIFAYGVITIALNIICVYSVLSYLKAKHEKNENKMNRMNEMNESKTSENKTNESKMNKTSGVKKSTEFPDIFPPNLSVLLITTFVWNVLIFIVVWDIFRRFF